jgi:hypothetical protein
MTNGMSRFYFYLTQLEEHLSKASKDASPAEWLFANNSRTPLFMLQALAKLYSNLHDKPMFTKIKVHFKELEDLLGDIDHYHFYLKEFSKKEGIPPIILSYFKRKREENVQLLNDKLVEKKWLLLKKNRIEKIWKKIQGADWMKEKDEVIAIKTFYSNSIIEINVFYRSAEGQFTDMENQVHALRRKLRWLSIYAQALRGSIQLTDSNPEDEKINKYLVPDIINSPFNKMPDAGSNRHFLLLEKDYYLSLSWMIAELGKLKDAGLSIMAINNALAFHKDDLPGNAEHIQKIVSQEDTLESNLTKASQISKDYFEEKNLEKIIVSIGTVKN